MDFSPGDYHYIPVTAMLCSEIAYPVFSFQIHFSLLCQRTVCGVEASNLTSWTKFLHVDIKLYQEWVPLCVFFSNEEEFWKEKIEFCWIFFLKEKIEFYYYFLIIVMYFQRWYLLENVNVLSFFFMLSSDWKCEWVGSWFCFQFWGSKGARQMGALTMFMLGNCKWDVTSYFISHNESMYVKSSRCSLQQSEAAHSGENNSVVLSSEITATAQGNDRGTNLSTIVLCQVQKAELGP